MMPSLTGVHATMRTVKHVCRALKHMPTMAAQKIACLDSCRTCPRWLFTMAAQTAVPETAFALLQRRSAFESALNTHGGMELLVYLVVCTQSKQVMDAFT